MTNSIKAGALRRFGALFYDGLMVIAVIMAATALFLGIVNILSSYEVLSLSGYLDMSDYVTRHPTVSPIFTAYVFMVWAGFFAFFWCRSGQTIGMRAWRLRVQNSDGTLITFTQALIRFATGLFGLGNLTVWIDPDKRAFQDIWAKTEVVIVPKGYKLHTE